eukprot:5861123-Pyramimonas_sp.AAC.1
MDLDRTWRVEFYKVRTNAANVARVRPAVVRVDRMDSIDPADIWAGPDDRKKPPPKPRPRKPKSTTRDDHDGRDDGVGKEKKKRRRPAEGVVPDPGGGHGRDADGHGSGGDDLSDVV